MGERQGRGPRQRQMAAVHGHMISSRCVDRRQCKSEPGKSPSARRISTQKPLSGLAIWRLAPFWNGLPGWTPGRGTCSAAHNLVLWGYPL